MTRAMAGAVEATEDQQTPECLRSGKYRSYYSDYVTNLDNKLIMESLLGGGVLHGRVAGGCCRLDVDTCDRGI